MISYGTISPFFPPPFSNCFVRIITSVSTQKIMELQQKISNQETIIGDLKSKHDSNLKYISLQLFTLQRSLMEKENHLSQLIKEREQVLSILFLNKVCQDL